MSETNEAVRLRIGAMEQTALGMAEAKDWTSRLELDVAGLTVQLSDCCPKTKKELTNLEQELAKLKGEMKATSPKAESPAPPAVDVAGPPASLPPPPAKPPFKSSPSVKPAPKPGRVKVSPPLCLSKLAKRFPPLMKKGKLHLSRGSQTKEGYDIPEGIIAHLMGECGGNVHAHPVVEVTCGSFKKETIGVSPRSEVYLDNPEYAAKNIADLEAGLEFRSAHCPHSEDIPHTRNNWVCYDSRRGESCQHTAQSVRLIVIRALLI
jgi:hypothetical protein